MFKIVPNSLPSLEVCSGSTVDLFKLVHRLTGSDALVRISYLCRESGIMYGDNIHWGIGHISFPLDSAEDC